MYYFLVTLSLLNMGGFRILAVEESKGVEDISCQVNNRPSTNANRIVEGLHVVANKALSEGDFETLGYLRGVGVFAEGMSLAEEREKKKTLEKLLNQALKDDSDLGLRKDNSDTLIRQMMEYDTAFCDFVSNCFISATPLVGRFIVDRIFNFLMAQKSKVFLGSLLSVKNYENFCYFFIPLDPRGSSYFGAYSSWNEVMQFDAASFWECAKKEYLRLFIADIKNVVSAVTISRFINELLCYSDDVFDCKRILSEILLCFSSSEVINDMITESLLGNRELMKLLLRLADVELRVGENQAQPVTEAIVHNVLRILSIAMRPVSSEAQADTQTNIREIAQQFLIYIAQKSKPAREQLQEVDFNGQSWAQPIIDMCQISGPASGVVGLRTPIAPSVPLSGAASLRAITPAVEPVPMATDTPVEEATAETPLLGGRPRRQQQNRVLNCLKYLACCCSKSS